MSPITQAVKDAGYKITSPRKTVFDWLEAYQGIFCVQDILRAFGSLDKVSVYRTIDLLVELDIIHQTVHLEGNQYYEKHGHDDEHHHHVICTECKKTESVPCDMTTPKIKGFKQVHHSVHMTGVCKACDKE